MSAPQWPAGEYVAEPEATPARRAEFIAEIDRQPATVRSAVAGLSNEQLDAKYRNWTVRQIVHHLADSHANAYVRFRVALTEENPTIKPYDETRWSELPDARTHDVEVSLKMLEALHARWVALLHAMGDADFARTYYHPEHQKTFRLSEVLGMYAHHGRHHAGQLAWQRKNG